MNADGIVTELRRRRAVEQLTQKELAERAGIPAQALTRFENARHKPTLHTACDVAAGLGLRLTLTGPDEATERRHTLAYIRQLEQENTVLRGGPDALHARNGELWRQLAHAQRRIEEVSARLAEARRRTEVAERTAHAADQARVRAEKALADVLAEARTAPPPATEPDAPVDAGFVARLTAGLDALARLKRPTHDDIDALREAAYGRDPHAADREQKTA